LWGSIEEGNPDIVFLESLYVLESSLPGAFGYGVLISLLVRELYLASAVDLDGIPKAYQETW
jgi:hypothetical protein